MRVSQSRLDPSPTRPGNIRISVDVQYDNPALAQETYWFEVDQSQKQFLSDTGNPWALCLTPVALTLQEPLVLDQPVDAAVLKHINELMRVWGFWFPKLKPIQIYAGINTIPALHGADKTLSFFSGGVDAFFTALYHEETSDPYEKIHIDDLVYIWGFDISYLNIEANEKNERSLRQAATKMGRQMVTVASNIKLTQLKNCDWESLGHGAVLAGVAYLLEKKYNKALIASSGGYRDAFPHGSHPALMPLFSSPRLQFKQSGATFSRPEKIEWISRSDVARGHLHVCFMTDSDKNCSLCLKCYRAMLILDIFGALKYFKTFDSSSFDLKKAGKLFLWGADDTRQAVELKFLASQKNRLDIVKAMSDSLRRTHQVKMILRSMRVLTKTVVGRKLYQRIENRLLRGFVGGGERYHPAPADSMFVKYHEMNF